MTRRKRSHRKIVLQSIEDYTGKAVRKGEVDISTLEDSVFQIIFSSLFRDKDSSKASCLMDVVNLTTEIGVRRVKAGIFVVGSDTHRWLAEGIYRYCFLDLGEEMVQIKLGAPDSLYDKLNILVVRPNESKVIREIDYTDVEL